MLKLFTRNARTVNRALDRALTTLGPASLGTNTTAGTRRVRELKLGATPLNDQPHLLDAVIGKGDGIATIFVVDGPDFVRINTTLRNSDGSRAVGTALDQKSPAYAALREGKSREGLFELFGFSTYAFYTPIFDAQGTVIGAYFAGAPDQRSQFQLLFWFLGMGALLTLAAVFGWQQLRGEIRDRGETEARDAITSLKVQLQQTDKVYTDLTRASVSVLAATAMKFGAPTRGGTSLVGERQTQELRFGNTVINNHYDIVDNVTAQLRGTATLFVADGDDFVRVSTNVKRSDGSRAIGTLLDKKGKAYAALHAGKSYTGLVDILGAAYYTHYAPITDASGTVVGIYYAGYLVDTLEQVNQWLTESRILNNGFMALVNQKNELLFHSSNVPDNWLTRLPVLATTAALDHSIHEGDYELSVSAFDPWNFKIVSSLYVPDLSKETFLLLRKSLGILAIVVLLLLTVSWKMAGRMAIALHSARRSRADAEEARLFADKARITAENANAALAAEMAEATRYVEALLPQRLKGGVVATDWLYRPSTSLGGDAFGYHWLDETHLAIYLLDVCGHGVGAALLATSAINAIRSQTLRNADFYLPHSVLAGLNAAFSMESQNNMYFTIWYGVYDTTTRNLHFSSAGHHGAVLVEPNKKRTILESEGLVIGVMPDVEYQTEQYTIPVGSRLHVFSDGTYEVQTAAGEFELTQFADVIEQVVNNEGSTTDILVSMQNVQGRNNFDDDFSMLQLCF